MERAGDVLALCEPPCCDYCLRCFYGMVFLPVVHQLVGILPLVVGQVALLCVRSLLLTSVQLKYVPQFKPSVVSLMMAL